MGRSIVSAWVCAALLAVALAACASGTPSAAGASASATAPTSSTATASSGIPPITAEEIADLAAEDQIEVRVQDVDTDVSVDAAAQSSLMKLGFLQGHRPSHATVALIALRDEDPAGAPDRPAIVMFYDDVTVPVSAPIGATNVPLTSTGTFFSIVDATSGDFITAGSY